jgi:hypothetical protein
MKLLIWAQWHNNIQECELLIPVIQHSL